MRNDQPQLVNAGFLPSTVAQIAPFLWGKKPRSSFRGEKTEKSGHIEVLMNDSVMFAVELYNKMIVYN